MQRHAVVRAEKGKIQTCNDDTKSSHARTMQLKNKHANTGTQFPQSNGANAPSLLPARLVDVGLDSNVNSGDGQVAAVVVLDVIKGANESIVRLGLSCSGAGAGSGVSSTESRGRR